MLRVRGISKEKQNNQLCAGQHKFPTTFSSEKDQSRWNFLESFNKRRFVNTDGSRKYILINHVVIDGVGWRQQLSFDVAIVHVEQAIFLGKRDSHIAVLFL